MTPVGLPPFCEIGKAYKGEGVRVPGLPPPPRGCARPRQCSQHGLSGYRRQQKQNSDAEYETYIRISRLASALVAAQEQLSEFERMRRSSMPGAEGHALVGLTVDRANGERIMTSICEKIDR